MAIRLSAAEFKQQFGTTMRNQVVNSGMLTSSGITKFGKIKKEEFPSPLKKQKPQIRLPKKREPNKTEAEWMQLCSIADMFKVRELILFEPWSLNLPSGTRYTPDVVRILPTGANGAGMEITCYEVKGPHIHNERSVHAFKEARAAFPWMRFEFAQKRESGWTTTEE